MKTFLSFVILLGLVLTAAVSIAEVQTPSTYPNAGAPAVQNPQAQQDPSDPNGVASQLSDYKIEVGDELEIKSFFNPEVNDKILVRPDGKIALLMIGEVDAIGLTSNQLAASISEKYGKFFRRPETTVMIRAFGGRRVYVSGEVNHPQMIPLTPNMTALQAISAAEGFTGGAKTTEVVLIRRSSDGRPSAMKLNLKNAMHGKDMSQDIPLESFDILCVPRTKVSNVNDFIGKYFRNNIPIPFGMTYKPF